MLRKAALLCGADRLWNVTRHVLAAIIRKQDATMALYTINDQDIYLEETGPQNAPYAFLIHGWASSSYTWKPILPALSRRYRCIAIDLPGFGRSPVPSHPPTIPWYADLIARLIDYFSPNQPVLLLGHSMGGQIGATLALRYPLIVERMVLLNPALSGRLSTRVNLLIGPHVLAERFLPLEWLLHLLARTPLDYTELSAQAIELCRARTGFRRGLSTYSRRRSSSRSGTDARCMLSGHATE
jgi:pimeloyl-ACP methyl ester carboxylesterase